ncbi:hypothetical protein [Helicobacter rodentium]|nr:hypothetical protein [Helicobacter rodentium]
MQSSLWSLSIIIARLLRCYNNKVESKEGILCHCGERSGER